MEWEGKPGFDFCGSHLSVSMEKSRESCFPVSMGPQTHEIYSGISDEKSVQRVRLKIRKGLLSNQEAIADRKPTKRVAPLSTRPRTTLPKTTTMIRRRRDNTTRTILLTALTALVAAAGVVRAQPGGCVDTITSKIASSSDLRYFGSALRESGLAERLAGPGPLLVFAPTDDAFTSLESDSAVLNMDLTKLLEYHIAPRAGYEDYLAGRSGALRTLGGTVDNSPALGLVNTDARVLREIDACNGMVVAIDKILVPSKDASDSPTDSPLQPESECDPTNPSCCDVQPPGGYSCSQQKEWGKCSENWLVVGNGGGGFCERTCGRCGQATPAPAPAPAPPSRPDTPRSPTRGGRSDREEAYFDISDPEQACQCTTTGRSGNVDTGRAGCFEVNMAAEAASRWAGGLAPYWGGQAGTWSRLAGAWARQTFEDSTTSICYVKSPRGCAAARESQNFPGAKWRSCR